MYGLQLTVLVSALNFYTFTHLALQILKACVKGSLPGLTGRFQDAKLPTLPCTNSQVTSALKATFVLS